MSRDRERGRGGGRDGDSGGDDSHSRFDWVDGYRVQAAIRRRQIQRKKEREAEEQARAATKIPSQGGAALPSDAREKMEGQFGADLSEVKVHTGSKSAQAAKALGAKAVTDGANVHFAEGQFAPGTKEGDRLLAHELTHVVQGQGAGVQRKADEGREAEAQAGAAIEEPASEEDSAGPGETVAGAEAQTAPAEEKSAGAADAEGGEGEAAEELEVSDPAAPVEQEADETADAVADDLHADGEAEPGDPAGAEAEEEAAPEALHAKLDDGKVHAARAAQSPTPKGKKPKPASEKHAGGKRDERAAWRKYLVDLERLLRDRTGAEKEAHLDLKAQRDEHPVVGGVSEVAATVKGSADEAGDYGMAKLKGQQFQPRYKDNVVKMPDEGIWDEVFVALNAARPMLAGDPPDLEGAKSQLAAAVRQYREAHRRFYEYKSRTEEGAELSAKVLRGVEVGCDIVLVVLSAGIGSGSANVLKLGVEGTFKLAAEGVAKGLGKAAIKAGAVAGANKLAQGAAEEATGYAIDLEDHIDVKKILLEAGTAAATNVIGMLVGGALSKVFLRTLGEILGARMAPEGLLALAEALGVEGPIPAEYFVTKGWRFLVGLAGDACTTTLNTAVMATIEALRSGGNKPTKEQFVVMVVEQLIQNGFIQLLLHAAHTGKGRGKAPHADGKGGNAVGAAPPPEHVQQPAPGPAPDGSTPAAEGGVSQPMAEPADAQGVGESTAPSPEEAGGAARTHQADAAQQAPPEHVAAEESAASQPDAGSRHQGPYDPHQVRQYLTDRYPGGVKSRTVPKPNSKNVRLAGKAHGKTGVPFDQRGFPIFDDKAVFETRLPPNVAALQNRPAHFRAATAQLRDAINQGQVPRERFTPEQLEAIMAGDENIPGFTWHHHQDVGRMQLVPGETHGETGHMGGFKMWHKGD